MNRLLFGAPLGVGFLISSLVWAAPAAGEKPPTFTALKDAVAFIADCLDKNDLDRLAAACANKDGRTNKNALEALRRSNENTPLGKRYAGREFPTDKDTFKLGGHMSELGFIHIDFVKRDNAWRLDNIWMCR